MLMPKDWLVNLMFLLISMRPRCHASRQNHCNDDNLHWWKVCGHDHWEVDQWPSDQQWHTEPPGVQAEAHVSLPHPNTG